MGDSCLSQAMFAAAFGGVFGFVVGGVSSTYSPTLSMNGKAALAYVSKTSFQYAAITTTFIGVRCASEGLTAQKGVHNSIFGGIGVGVVSAMMKQNYKQGLAFGGVTAISMAALDLAGGTLDTRSEKDYQRFKFVTKANQTAA